jgi:large subunit ribosomal protein L32
MALPKRRHSKTRGRKRRTHWKLADPQLGTCSHCKSPKPAHTVCQVCGYYKGRQVMEIKEKKAKKKPS